MPLESLQTNFSNKCYQTCLKTTHLFLDFEELDIETELSCDFGYSISEIWSYSSPLNLLLNATGLT